MLIRSKQRHNDYGQVYSGASLLLAILLSIIFCLFLAAGAYFYRQEKVSAFRLKLLQDLLGKAAQDSFVFDTSGKLIFSHSAQQIPTYLDLVGFLEKQYTHYFSADNLLQKLRLSQTGSGLLVRRQDNALFLCEHTSALSSDFHVVLLKNITCQFQAISDLDLRYKKLQRFLDDAPFGLLYSDASANVIGANHAALNYLGKTGAEIVNRPADLVLAGNMTALSVHQTQGADLNTTHVIFPQHGSGKTFYDVSRLPSVVIDETGTIEEENLTFHELFPQMANFFDGVDPAIRSDIRSKLKLDTIDPFEVRFDKSDLCVTVYTSKLKLAEDKVGFLLQFVDISEQKQLEQQFIQSQKMQAVGQLAGGVAHDFNNLLTAIIGYCDLLLQRFLPNDGAYTDLIQIKQNANRAGNLVRQLLAFSRQQNLQFKCVNISDVLSEVTTLLKRLLGATIAVNVHHGQGLWPVRGDFGQFEQVLINLAVNARDAMKGEGSLTVTTSNCTIANDRKMGSDVLPKGEYVSIEVEDTGCGIPAEMINNIFDPFFSTKDVGAGTGLGLSTVYGIIKQSGGYIDVKSSSLGTTFVLYLPRYEGEVPLEKTKPAEIIDLTGNARILLIEDEDAVRIFSSRALREKGYLVTEASSGDEALEIIKKGESFDLIISDVVMPKMDGPTLCQHLRQIGCTTKIIFMSGYSEDTFRNALTQDGTIHFLSKPYNIQDLATKVKTVLG